MLNSAARNFFKQYKQGKLDKDSLTNYLMTRVEKSNEKNTRAECIKFLRKLKLKTAKVFCFLENVLISDESPLVRISAMRALLNSYPLKCTKEPIKWTLIHENNDFILKFLIDFLDFKVNNSFGELNKEINDWFFTSYDTNLTEAKALLEIGAYHVDISKKRALYYETSNKQVISLSLYRIGLSTLPKAFNRLKKLEILNLVGNKFKVVPRSIVSLRNLKDLDLSENFLQNIPGKITHLKYLKILDLSKNKFENFPITLLNVKGLSVLNLSDNNIREIPETINFLENLSILDLNGNDIELLPNSVNKLKNLTIHMNEKSKIIY